jgi:hypothetical protein
VFCGDPNYVEPTPEPKVVYEGVQVGTEELTTEENKENPVS